MRLQRSVDLGDQLALAVAGAQLEGAVGFRRGAVGEVGLVLALFLQVLQGPRLSRMSSFQVASFWRKYSRCRAFMNGSFSVGRYFCSCLCPFPLAAWISLWPL